MSKVKMNVSVQAKTEGGGGRNWDLEEPKNILEAKICIEEMLNEMENELQDGLARRRFRITKWLFELPYRAMKWLFRRRMSQLVEAERQYHEARQSLTSFRWGIYQLEKEDQTSEVVVKLQKLGEIERKMHGCILDMEKVVGKDESSTE